MKVKKIIYIVIGCVCLGLGFVGAVIPILPTVPFLMAASILFAKSSERLSLWFKETKVYKNNLETFVEGKGMEKKVKIRIMITVTILMTIGFVAMDKVLVGRIILGFVWVLHMIYFLFVVKTIEPEMK